MMRCINALSSAHFARNDPKTPLTNGEQGTKEECQYVKNVPISMITMQFRCPYLSSNVELNPERERHIAESHPDLLPEYKKYIAETLLDPDQVRLSERFKSARLFTRWFDFIRGGKYIVVVVISESKPVKRHWVITAYLARKLAGGETEWKKN